MKMRRTLYLKFLGGYILFGILAFITIATFTSQMILKHLTRVQAASLYREAQLVASNYALRIYSNDEDGASAAESQLKAIDTYISADIWVINNSSKVLFDSRAKEGDEDRIYSEFDPSASGTYYMTGNFYDAFDVDMLSVFSPITSNFKVIGYVVIHQPLSSIVASRNEILNITYIALGIILLLSLIIIGVFTFAVYLPLNRVTKAAEEYAAGNLTYHVKESGAHDEMSYLTATLNYMAHQIAQSEDNQKKFIANVSHDFRSPLTSIRGYLEAMIDGTIPPEMYEKYLTIVVNETQRLTKLTNGLLELNTFDKKGMVLEVADFDINGIIKRTAETFGGICKEKKISIELVLTGSTLIVHADMSKIQQVLYNLLDNAIKFSYNNSVIKIETTIKNEKVFVSVKDSGIGIPKESIHKVFDRFYKSDLSRGKDKKGTGLGLSIVKEIIQAHNENINVISTEGVGTEFIFTLAKSKKDKER
ncbi:Signal transduction histidine kinase [Lachnospiraceae bacterium KH1T2]|nr:Signal transduction histidine kinase [Lachnospiraceae bacterium KH1T2]